MVMETQKPTQDNDGVSSAVMCTLCILNVQVLDLSEVSSKLILRLFNTPEEVLHLMSADRIQ